MKLSKRDLKTIRDFLSENIDLIKINDAVSWLHSCACAMLCDLDRQQPNAHRQPERVDVADLIEKLVVANHKLFVGCDKKAAMADRPGDRSPEEIAENMRQDIALCNLRGSLKNQINQALGCTQDVKIYGKDST